MVLPGMPARTAAVALKQQISKEALRPLSPSKASEVAVAHQSAVRFVPETEGE